MLGLVVAAVAGAAALWVATMAGSFYGLLWMIGELDEGD